jgi:tetratricopeptide (TPR) repeat protein
MDQSSNCRSLSLAALLAMSQVSATAVAADSSPTYAGSHSCAACHEAETNAWQGSHHDLAMTEATDESMLGDFEDASFTAHGVTSSFYRKDGGWYVRTDGPDGELADYRIDYTFGWYPLQQYLVEFPGGRYQCLPLAWDSRPADEGGQRWFHLYPNEKDMGPDHPLHWTGPEQNWNYQCAECHSTELQKGFDLETDSFKTTWEEIDVACEACHGPGSLHNAQAARVAAGDADAWGEAKGLVAELGDRDGGSWSVDPDTGIPARSAPREDQTEIELCARCHSRRGQIHADYEHGKTLGNTHRLSLLDERLYHADGQILDEVYVYGSFIQSKMFQAGVTCSDCHDPHSLALIAEGDLVCAQCHEQGRYAAESHHHHQPGSTGASCVECHMPQQLYMVNDPRADHSMRIPRPDLSGELGSPNACTHCHQDKDDAWAVESMNSWYGKDWATPHYGQALHAGRTAALDAGKRLMDLAVDSDRPGIARATALDLLRAFPEPAHELALPRLLSDEDPLVRAAAVRYLETADGDTRFRLGMPLLDDPVRVVRVDAARVLAPLARYELPKDAAARLAAGLDAYRAAQMATSERPEAHLNIGVLETATGKAALAQRAYRTALRLDPAFAPAYVNLADLYRSLGGDAEGEKLLLKGIAAVPESGGLHHALGLLYVRTGRMEQAVPALTRAAELEPERPRYAYVQALAIRESGDLPKALEVLESARQRHPNSSELLSALATLHRDAGHRTLALAYARELAALNPSHREAENLVKELSGGE